MKLKRKILSVIILLAISGLNDAIGQWATSGSNIYNTNTGNVGIANSSPSTLLYVAKNMTEPAITVRNLGGTGGATYSMIDNASGANWKFKATSTGGFKIRDHAHSLDVITIEPNSANNALYINTAGSVGIGTATPAASAALDVSSSTKGFLVPRMTSNQITVIQNPSNGLMVYCTTDAHTYVYTSSTASWRRLNYDSQVINPCFTFSVTHSAGNVAPVTKTVTYGTVLTNLTGSNKCWITQNLGSDHQAASATDATEASAGWYWQFNKQQGYKHDGTTRTPNTSWIVPINESSDWTSANDPCALLLGSGWRLPTNGELYAVDFYGGWDNYTETFSSVLKIHAAGYLYYTNGNLNFRGTVGAYYSSSQYDNIKAYGMVIGSNFCATGYDYKSYSYPVRCLKDL
jgi:hypothetical protein